MIRNKRQTIAKNIFVYGMLAYPILQFVVFWFSKNITTITMAFKTVENGQEVFAGLTNFSELLSRFKTEKLFQISLKNSILNFILAFVISVPLYIIFSYYIFKKCFGSRTLQFMMMIPKIVSSIIMVLIFKRVVEDILPMLFYSVNPEFPNLLKDGRYAFWTQLVFNIWLSFSTNILIYPNAMNAISPEVIESARLDGAGELRTFWTIAMPMVKPGWLTLIVYSFKDLWNQGSSIYIHSEQLKSLNYAIGQITAGGIRRAGASAAATVVMMAVPIIVFVISQSNIIETMGSSGMKD